MTNPSVWDSFGSAAGFRPQRPALLVCALGLALATCLYGQEAQAPGYRSYAKGPLTADDYQSSIPGERNGLDAYTTTDLKFEFQYRTHRSRRHVRAWTTSISVYAAVDSSESWNRRPQDRRLMDHEQGHFDLTHIAAMQAQRHFATSGRLTGVAASEDLAAAELHRQLEQQLKVFVDGLRDKHHEYDEITHHGLKHREQGEQRRLQREQIAALAAELQAPIPGP